MLIKNKGVCHRDLKLGNTFLLIKKNLNYL